MSVVTDFGGHMGLGERHSIRFVRNFSIAVCGLLLSFYACADDTPDLGDAAFSTFAVADLDLRMPQSGSAEVAVGSNDLVIPGYPLTTEELNLILESPGSTSDFSSIPLEAAYFDDQVRQPFGTRVVGWIKQRSSDFNLFKLFDADDTSPGVRLDVDTEEEELVLQYRVGF